MGALSAALRCGIGYARAMPFVVGLTLALLALPCAAAAQGASAQGAPTRIHVVGASVSGGFEDGPLFGGETQGDSIAMRRIWQRWCGEAARVTTHSPVEMCFMFRDPARIGRRQLKFAKRKQPDLVVAVDFLFWFAYGVVAGDEAEARERRLREGLALLAELDAPVLLGDLPDMRGAATRMLRPAQVPSVPVLLALNQRVRAFARGRPNVTLVPLAALVAELRGEGVTLPFSSGPVRTAPLALLQPDRLHATRLGAAYLAYRMQGALRGRFSGAHPLGSRERTFDAFVEAAGAVDEAELARRSGGPGRGARR